MNITEWESFLGFDDILNLPNRVMQIITGDKSKRDEIYREAIKLHGSDLSYDWFLDIYMEELAKRKDNKQYFTPREVPDICAILTGTDGIVHEPTAGTGGLLIAYWWNKASTKFPWRFKPSTCIVSCWELTDRSIPLLLFNLSIRGIMGEVFHGDVLENSAKARYVLLNERDDALAFSDIVRDDSILGYRYGRPSENPQPGLFDKI
ncbi:N-6 DNA methylase [Alistipes onderdonkii]|jgi:type I restriction-modification system DNA methylase subunit|uniref:N-6 DNA methylase n=1 Tax=Alistipes onderdonkii TaxID=328813 RepID=UPI0034A5A8B0